MDVSKRRGEEAAVFGVLGKFDGLMTLVPCVVILCWVFLGSADVEKHGQLQSRKNTSYSSS